jgi:hypothetical protein
MAPGGPPGMPPVAPQPTAYTMAPAAKRGNGAAITSLILGILFCVPFLTSFLAVIFGFVGVRKARDPHVSGKGLAITGLLLGLLGLAGWSLVFASGGYAIYAAYKYGEPVRSAAKQFALDLSTGNVDAAKSRTTDRIKREDLVRASDNLKALGPIQDTTLFSSKWNTENGVTSMEVAGVIHFPRDKTVPYYVHFVKEGDAFKIDGVLLENVMTAGTTPKSKSSKSSSDDD